MATKREQIISKVLEILKQDPQGVRYSEIIKKVQAALPGMSENTIHGTVWDLHLERPNEVYKPERGLFRLTSFRGKDEQPKPVQPSGKVVIREQDFYESFAKHLETELDECSKAIPLGGNKFKDKWGTPDVIGKNESKKSDIIKHETEIISAEIKTDSTDLITAFGQACAYKSFSHKVYIVIPKNASDTDKYRVESLCLIFGIGLILFNSTNVQNPEYEIRVRPIKYEPDSFYVNEYMKLIEKELFT
jgi:hypothetical protein